MSNKKISIIDLEDIKVVVNLFLKNWYILLIAILFSIVFFYVYTYKMPNIYQAESQILLKTNDQVNEQNIIGENFGAYYNWWNKSNIDNTTEMRIIQSYDLIESAVKRMNLDVSYIIVGRIKTTEVYTDVPFTIKIVNVSPELYEKNIPLKILDEKKYQIFLMKHGQEVVKEGYFGQDFIDTDISINVKNELITTENIKSMSEIDYQFKVHRISTLVSKFQGSLIVENPDLTNILSLKLDDVIPERAQAFLDTLVAVYIENSVKNRFEINSNTLKYIEKQMYEVVEVLNQIEDTMQGYKENKAILDLAKEQDDYFAKMSFYDNQRSKLRLELGALISLEKYIIEGKDPLFLPPSVYVVSDDAFLKKSVTELYELQIKVNERLTGSTLANYSVKEYQQQIESLKQNLLVYINNSKKAVSENTADVEKQIDFYVSNIKTIPKKERDLLGIERNFDINQKMYLFLLEKKSNTIIARAGILPEIKVVETARPLGIISPNKRKILYYFIFSGLIIGLFVSFLRYYMFHTIDNLIELKSITKLPILGEILISPDAEKNYIVVDKDPKSPITESFRTIRTNLQYFATDGSSKIILITSYNPGEGKTFCSINIATILAKAEKKILVVELDLHKPKIQKALEMSSEIGVSTILIGKHTIQQGILQTSIANIDVLLSGPIPPNASEIILNDRLNSIFEYAKKNYDYVIVDTAPIGLITDALVIMKQVDTVLFVLNTKFAKKQIIHATEDMVEMNKIKNFGFILNGVKRRKSNYYYNYGYGYGYGYGSRYGYGYGEYKNK